MAASAHADGDSIYPQMSPGHVFLGPGDAGVPKEIFDLVRSIRTGPPLQWHSCFISYSTEDEEFATRLHNDFQAKGIRCWKWDHDARTGRSLWDEIDKAIRVYDKLVLIASESSLKSAAVNREIERALVQEDERHAQTTEPPQPVQRPQKALRPRQPIDRGDASERAQMRARSNVVNQGFELVDYGITHIFEEVLSR